MPGPGQRGKNPKAMWRFRNKKRTKGNWKKHAATDKSGKKLKKKPGVAPGINDGYGAGDKGAIDPPWGSAKGGRIGHSSGGVTSWQELVKKKYSS